MKACSFNTAATNIIYQLGLEDLLFGVTFESNVDKPIVVHSILENRQLSSEEIDNIVVQSKRDGRSLYYIDSELLKSISPDVIFVQDICDVCEIDSGFVYRAIEALDKKPFLVPLNPRTLDDVYDTIITIAKSLGKEERAYDLLAKLKSRTSFILDRLRTHSAPLRRVMLMEWLNPIYNCGHWIPFQIAQAGGVDMLSNPGGYSTAVSWNKIVEYDPEVLIIAPCGFRVEQTLKEIHVLADKFDWKGITAVKNSAVFIADADLFTMPSAALTDGIELLAALFHQNIFQIPERLINKVTPLDEASIKMGF